MIENQKPDAELPIIQFHHVPAFWAFGGTICAIFCAIRVGCQQLAGIWTQFKLCHCKHTSSSHRKPKCPAAELKWVFPTYTGQHCKVQITTLINIPRFVLQAPGRGRLFGEKLGSTIVIDQVGIIAMVLVFQRNIAIGGFTKGFKDVHQLLAPLVYGWFLVREPLVKQWNDNSPLLRSTCYSQSFPKIFLVKCCGVDRLSRK